MRGAAAAHPVRVARQSRVRAAVAPESCTVRPATVADADGIHALITRYRSAGQLLPRTRADIAAHVDRFVVVSDGRAVIGCADLAPLSATVAEVRSLVVDERAQGAGLGRRLLATLAARAAANGFAQLCALTHAPSYFVAFGFSLVPHQWLPEKIEKDCRGCAQFRQCGQQAVVLPLVRSVHA